VEGEAKNWPEFFARCVLDEPNIPIIKIMTALLISGADVWIWSGRSDEVREQTLEWLDRHCVELPLFMRAKGNHVPDEKLKKAWLDCMSSNDRKRLVAIFEDRDRMVEMWRAEGIACLQVAPGNF
jgi:hypothetical protein